MKRYVIATLMALAAAPVAAHEPREVADGLYEIEVGWRTEPAIEDVLNNLDFFVVRADGTAVSVRDGDSLDVNFEVLYLADDDFSAPVLAHRDLGSDLNQDFVNASRYNIPFIPTKNGAYGFRLTGTIEGHAVDETFVCGAGSQSIDEAFDCVTNAVTFPFGTWSRYIDN